MSRTHSPHVPTAEYNRRAHTRRRLLLQEQLEHKPVKASRKRERDLLREEVKEYR
jgi:hypothetical protein